MQSEPLFYYDAHIALWKWAEMNYRKPLTEWPGWADYTSDDIDMNAPVGLRFLCSYVKKNRWWYRENDDVYENCTCLCPVRWDYCEGQFKGSHDCKPMYNRWLKITEDCAKSSTRSLNVMRIKLARKFQGLFIAENVPVRFAGEF